MKCPKCNTEINPAAMLGSIKSAVKAKSSRENGKLGGRPRSEMKTKTCIMCGKLFAPTKSTISCADCYGSCKEKDGRP